MSDVIKQQGKKMRSPLAATSGLVYWIRTYLKTENLLHTRDTRATVGILRVNPAICTVESTRGACANATTIVRTVRGQRTSPIRGNLFFVSMGAS